MISICIPTLGAGGDIHDQDTSVHEIPLSDSIEIFEKDITKLFQMHRISISVVTAMAAIGLTDLFVKDEFIRRKNLQDAYTCLIDCINSFGYDVKDGVVRRISGT